MTPKSTRASAADAPAPRRLVLDERIRYRYSAPVTTLRQYLRVVPPSTHGPQRRDRWQLAVNGVASSSARTYLDPFGNVTVAVDVPRVEEAVEFAVTAEAVTALTAVTAGSAGHAGHAGHAEGGTDAASPPAGLADPRYLQATWLTATDDAIAELARGTAGTDVGTTDVESLCERVHRVIAYEWGITGVRTTASQAVAAGRGVCQDYAHIMLAACRHAGIAARYVSGHLIGEGGSHAWVEVLHPGDGPGKTWWAEGWDPTHGRRTDADYLVVAVGRDYTDTAPLWGTFIGTGVTGTLEVDKRLSA